MGDETGAARGGLEAGAVVPVLADWPGEGGQLSVVWREGRVLPRKIRALIDVAAEDMRAAGIP